VFSTIAGAAVEMYQAGLFIGAVAVVGRYLIQTRQGRPKRHRALSFSFDAPSQSGRYLIRPLVDFFGKRQQAISPPLQLQEFMFKSRGVQLPDSVVWQFSKWAWDNRARGRGLSERSWGGNGRVANRTLPAWWVAEYYRPMLYLLAVAQSVTGRQIVEIKSNGWKMIMVHYRDIYRLLQSVEAMKRV